MPRPIEPGERHTYGDWQTLGYQVQYGQRMVGRDEFGQAVFDASQVRPRTNNTFASLPRRFGYQPTPRRPRPVERWGEIAPQDGVYQPQINVNTIRDWWGQPATSNTTSSDVRYWRASDLIYEQSDINTKKQRALMAAQREVYEASAAVQNSERALNALVRKYNRKLVPTDDPPSGFVRLLKGEKT